MLIKQCKGYELEKEKSNTSEDFFNRSEVTYLENGKERTLHVLYVRYFEQVLNEFTPFQQDPVFCIQGKDVYFKDLAALVCLLKNPGLKGRKRLYINSKHEFSSYFQGINFEKLPEIFLELNQTKGYELRSPLEFVKQQQ
ncbi:hypothetical protein [Neobacillus sp. Marseille-QA0830]